MTNVQRESAKIYTFPARPHVVAEAYQGNATSITTLASRRPTISYGAWYHEAALTESDRDSSH